MAHTVIIGNGISGITCARHVRKLSDDRITIISGESDYFFSRTALMYIFMGHMKYDHTKPYEDLFWEKNRLDLKKAWVQSIDVGQQLLFFEEGDSMRYDRLVLATGSVPRWLDIPGVDLDGVQGFYSLQDLEKLEQQTNLITRSKVGDERAVIIGGGLIGVEVAEMLRTRGVEVTVLVREERYWAGVLSAEEAELVHEQFEHHGVDLRFSTQASEILGDQNSKVVGVKTNNGETIQCSMVCLAIGVQSNTSLAKSAGLDVDRGVLVDEYLQTPHKNIYAIGDCAQLRNPPTGVSSINQVWYTGRMMGETLSRTLVGKPTKYQPGPWFNSAKFFELEYQTYGRVSPDKLPGQSVLFWFDQAKTKSIKVVFDIDSFKILGVNVLGLRIRHELMDEYLRNGSEVTEVLKRFDKVMFDPEFSTDYHGELLDKWNELYPSHEIRKKRLKWF